MTYRSKILVHGYGGYTGGCKCDVCVAAKRERQREYRDAARARAAAAAENGGRYVAPVETHGQSAYKNHRCRCPVCTEAKAAEDRRRSVKAGAS